MIRSTRLTADSIETVPCEFPHVLAKEGSGRWSEKVNPGYPVSTAVLIDEVKEVYLQGTDVP